MKKKRILYSELAPTSDAPMAPVPAAPAASTPAAAPARARAPVDLARALAAARAAEQQGSAPAAAPVPPVAPVPASVAVLPSAPARSPAVPAPRVIRDRARARSGREEILLFRIGDERFGIELAAVEEAVDIPPVHHVPEMPPAMLGVITVRGTLTAVYSPAAALGLSLHDGTSALIFRRGRTRVAIVVDEVDDVTTLDLSLLRDAPALEAGDGIVLGVLRQRDVLLALVDADALIAACQAASLLETA
jgi:purine-binding chemotaxis protein CheW